MLMPIVSMNKMAMNESVATSCCYREVVDVTNIVWKTLYGGYIGTAYVDNGWSWKDDLSQQDRAIANAGYDLRKSGAYVDASTAAGGYALNLIWAQPVVQTLPIGTGTFETNASYQWCFEVTGGVYVPAALAASQLGLSFASCGHDTTSCVYKTHSQSLASNQHIGATAKHDTGGDSWAKPHSAKQFNS